MKINLIFLLLFLVFGSCKKEKTEYINHNSEIFFGADTLIYGNWQYLYTWERGGYAGISTKTNKNEPYLSITPFGNYDQRMLGEIIEKGTIDTVSHSLGYLFVNFYPDAIKTPQPYIYLIFNPHIDTLITTFSTGGYDDLITTKYYKRIR